MPCSLGKGNGVGCRGRGRRRAGGIAGPSLEQWAVRPVHGSAREKVNTSDMDDRGRAQLCMAEAVEGRGPMNRERKVDRVDMGSAAYQGGRR